MTALPEPPETPRPRRFGPRWMVDRIAALATDAEYRGALRMRLFPPAGTFQRSNTTEPNRYPAIFAFVRDQLGADCAGRLLSFGCSTGEEVFALRGYFPVAAIRGIDLGATNIALCQKRLQAAGGDPGIDFVRRGNTAAEPEESYDAIFAMAVFRDGRIAPGRQSCAPNLDFRDFARAVADMHRCLRPGGLLVMRHAQFRLSDTPAGPAFETLLDLPYRQPGMTPVFGPGNRLIPGFDESATVFRKLPGQMAVRSG